MKKNFIIIAGLLFSLTVQAQAPAAAAPAANDQFFRIMSMVLFGLVGLIFLIAMIYMVRVNSFLTRELMTAKFGAPETSVQAQKLAEKFDFWGNFKKKYWEDAVPIEQEHEVMMHHSYDGIRELDNKLPPWWVNLFYVTIVFAGIYMYWYHFGGNGKSQREEYAMAVEEGEAIKAKARAAQANLIDENNLKPITDQALLSEGAMTYKNLCVACHGAAGEGGVGPNMTDEYWLHGGGVKNIYNTIKNGVPDKGMIAWSSQLSPADMHKVASYILGMKGTNPANAKAPQGQIWKEEAAATDTTQVKQAEVK